MITRRTNTINPETDKHDGEVAGAIERWEERYRTLHEEEKDERLPEKYRMAAIRKMLTGDIKRHVDLHISKITGYDMLRSTIMNWAVDRKLDRDRNDDLMELIMQNGLMTMSPGHGTRQHPQTETGKMCLMRHKEMKHWT